MYLNSKYIESFNFSFEGSTKGMTRRLYSKLILKNFNLNMNRILEPLQSLNANEELSLKFFGDNLSIFYVIN